MRAALGWLLLFTASLVVVLGFLLGKGEWLDTDITHLMPAESRDPVVSRALGRDRLGVSAELSFMVIGPDAASGEAARLIRDQLDAATEVTGEEAGSHQALVAFLAPYRFALLSERRQSALREDPAGQYLRAVQSRLARPSPGIGASFSDDPPGFLAEYVSELPAPYPGLRARDGLWRGEHGDDALWLIPRRLTGNAFEGAFQSRVTELVAESRRAARAACPDCEILTSGPVLFAADQRALAHREISLISSLSLGGILLLVLAAFGSLRPLLLGAVALLSGVLTAAALSLLLFGALHVITLVAGTTLLGIAIDYVFKYLVHRGEQAAGGGQAVVKRLRRPLILGVASSLLCLLVLAVSPFPVMRELAVFSGAGLAGAWLTVVLLFPWLDRGHALRLRPSLVSLFNRPVALFAGLGRGRWLLPLICLPLGLVAYLNMPGSDDLRAFQAELPERMTMDQRLRRLAGTAFPEGFFIIQGKDADAVLAREAELLERLANGGARNAVALSRLLPTTHRQAEAHELIGRALNDPALAQSLMDLGLAQGEFARLRQDWANAEGRWLEPSQLAEGPLAPLADNLWLPDQGEGPASLVVLRGGVDETILANLPEWVRFIRPVAQMNANLGAQREAAGHWILTAALLGIPGLFLLVLGRRQGLRPALAPLCTLGLTLGFLAVSGIGLNTFVLMGVILGLGVGADYAAFLAAEDRVSPAGVTGIALAALTTLLAFGLLGLSQITALGQFGLTVVVAIVAAWLSAFVLALPASFNQEKSA